MDVTMPQLGETVTEGTITRWLKQVGESVEADEPLFEVSTDKVDSEVPAPGAGIVSEILVPEGETVEVGTRLAVLGDAGDAPAAPAEPWPRRRAGAPAAAAAPPPPPAPEAAAGAGGEHRARTGSCARTRAGRCGHRRAADGTRTRARGGTRRRFRVGAHAHVAHRAAPDRRARPGSGRHRRHGPRRTPHAQGRPRRAHLGCCGAGSGRARRTRPHRPATRTGRAGAPPLHQRQPPRRRRRPQPAAPAPAGGARDEIIPFDNIRRRTAEHMVRSLATSAHVYTSVEVDFERIERVRAAHRDAWKATEGLLAHVSPVHRPGVLRRGERLPARQRECR